MDVNPRRRNGRNAGARKGFKTMLRHARAQSRRTRTVKAIIKKIEVVL